MTNQRPCPLQNLTQGGPRCVPQVGGARAVVECRDYCALSGCNAAPDLGPALASLALGLLLHAVTSSAI